MVKFQSYMLLKEKIQELYPQQPLEFTFDNELVHRRTKMILTKSSADKDLNDQVVIDSGSSEEVLFNKVFEEMVDSRKPLIVHNGFLDLMHVISAQL